MRQGGLTGALLTLMGIVLFLGPPPASAGGLEYMKAGIKADKSGDTSEALRLYGLAIDSGELSQADLSYTLYNRGVVWSYKEEFDCAIGDFDRALEITPQDAAAYRDRGAAWANKGDYDRAIADFGRALKITPQDAAAYRNRGMAWEYKKDCDRAIADLDRALKIDPKDAEAYNGCAWLYATAGRKEYRNGKLAVQYAHEAFDLDGYNPAYLDTLAAAYAEAGLLNEAIAFEERAIRILKIQGGNDISECTQHLDSFKAGKAWTE